LGLTDRRAELNGSGDPHTETVAKKGAGGFQIVSARGGGVELLVDRVLVRGLRGEGVGDLAEITSRSTGNGTPC